MRIQSPEFSSDLFDTYAKIVADSDELYIGAGMRNGRATLGKTKIKRFEIELLQIISKRFGNLTLTALQAVDLLDRIHKLEKLVSKATNTDIDARFPLELEEIVPPIYYSILYFLVCSCADVEINSLKKKLRAQNRDKKRQKSGKTSNATHSLFLDLQKLCSTKHWHNHTHKNPIPTGLLMLASSYHDLTLFTDYTMGKFESGEFPDKIVIKNLNKGSGVYFPWSIQTLVIYLDALRVENAINEVEFIFKKLIGKSFSIKSIMKQKSFGSLKDPHILYIQLQSLAISLRLTP